jgi:hypothetical protein
MLNLLINLYLLNNYCTISKGKWYYKEISVVGWSHETGETKFRASNFEEFFLEKLKRGDFEFN